MRAFSWAFFFALRDLSSVLRDLSSVFTHKSRLSDWYSAGSLVPRPSEVINLDGLGTTVSAFPKTGDPRKTLYTSVIRIETTGRDVDRTVSAESLRLNRTSPVLAARCGLYSVLATIRWHDLPAKGWHCTQEESIRRDRQMARYSHLSLLPMSILH